MNIIWESRLTAEMVSHLSEDEVQLLIDELNEAVAEIGESYEVN